MSKKGLSPLIATVLIIGFTVVLAALLILWVRGVNDEFMGGSLCDYQANLKCTQLDLEVYKISSVDNNITVTLASNSNIDVNKLILQAFEEGAIIISASFDGSTDNPIIERFDNKLLTFEVGNLENIDEIRIIPGLIFKENGESCEVYCSKIIKKVKF